jgi:hypothetical protein
MKLYKEILSKKEKTYLLKFVKTQLVDFGHNYPGLQTKPNLHLKNELNCFLKKIKKYHKNYNVKTCWANYSQGNYLCWHTHKDCDITMVYYLKNKNNIGTIFRKQIHEVEVTNCPENSLLVFDAKLEHAAPFHLPEDRYSIAITLSKK